ncbi:ABC transporter ATP-binding protein [Actinomadura rudentiformis]|uniref:ABC transporter ATP-binding protein n=1 Tax=Actinomadura rudentiformis TaxID=359158 RepID=A0A6H9YNA3_9ACTN|nr:ABC transporter ATP-binding protein [Actinomadura rudentiformis]
MTARPKGRPFPVRLISVIALSARAAPLHFAAYVVLAVVAGAGPVAVAWLTKLIIDGLVQGQRTGTLVGYTFGLGLAGLSAAVIPHLTRYLRAELDRQVGLVAQDRLLTAVNGFTGLARFEDPAFLDRLRLAQQSAATSPNQTVEGLLALVQAVITIVGFLGAMLVISPWITCLVMFSGIPMLVSEIVISRRRAAMFWEIGPVERRELFYAQLLTSVEAAKEVRIFGLGSYFRDRLLGERRKANAAKKRVDRRELLSQSSLGLMGAVLSAAVLLWSILAAKAGTVTVGDITLFVAAINGVQAALLESAGAIARCHESILMFDHFRTVVKAESDLSAPSRPRAVTPLENEIELRNVWFRYSADHPWVLKGVNLRIAKGETLALVGLNGAGKSTLVSLICRFYDPTRGSIRWDGVDIRDLDIAGLRERIGIVFQDYMTYDLTAAENIELGDLAKRDERALVHAAAQRAGIHEKIATLPRGYETLLSRVFYSFEGDTDDPETGVPLSGGQWQRLALARAFLRDKRDLMILDEPAAGLDAEAEHEIHSSLKRHRSGRTSLLISHRLGAVRSADTIVVLSDGVIVEVGDHETLLSAQGEYARLFNLQASGYTSVPSTEVF